MTEYNISVVDGQSFFAHETSINFTPGMFNLDFKNISPRIDPRSKAGPTFVLAHNTILMDPYHAKQFHAILGEALKRYEQDFGKIEKPKAMARAEKKQKSETSSTTHDVPAYFG